KCQISTQCYPGCISGSTFEGYTSPSGNTSMYRNCPGREGFGTTDETEVSVGIGLNVSRGRIVVDRTLVSKADELRYGRVIKVYCTGTLNFYTCGELVVDSQRNAGRNDHS